ncbi:uncharacterized protein MKK02DRAFT_40577 [Dioszegia hungarica]|uniref:Uncharacterized protein n=1 Tax=Dioszegia hungarica TaxID=4972 RepID=A0AA38H211_9TREE|nr:uncharacterized protein MKK02DRAFT_40577 [Dioszegia hungarica]KAI9632272.1 hypothetical protein MKK02DRAFT_40577 [Dioszegia hungarica]
MRDQSQTTGACPAPQTGPSPFSPHNTCVQAEHWLTSTRQSILDKGWADYGRWVDGDEELRAPLYHQPWDAERIEEWHRVRSLIWHSLPAELSRQPEVIAIVGPDAPLCSDLHQVLEQIHGRLLWELSPKEASSRCMHQKNIHPPGEPVRPLPQHHASQPVGLGLARTSGRIIDTPISRIVGSTAVGAISSAIGLPPLIPSRATEGREALHPHPGRRLLRSKAVSGAAPQDLGLGRRRSQSCLPYLPARERDLQSLRVLQAGTRVLQEIADGYDQRHFIIPDIHPSHRLQLCDGSFTAAKLVLMLHWSSLHDDNLILSSEAFTTVLLRQFGLLPPEESGLRQLAALNLFPIQATAHSKADDIACPKVDGTELPYPAVCLDRFKADRLDMIVQSIKTGNRQIFALFGKKRNEEIVAGVMDRLGDSYSRYSFKVAVPMLLDWEMGIEGVGLSVVKQSLLGRNTIKADEHIIRNPDSLFSIEERLAHHAANRPSVGIDFDLIVQGGDIRTVLVRPPHPSCCGYSNTSRLIAQSLDFTCQFLAGLLDGSLLNRPSSPPVVLHFPHSTIPLGTKAPSSTDFVWKSVFTLGQTVPLRLSTWRIYQAASGMTSSVMASLRSSQHQRSQHYPGATPLVSLSQISAPYTRTKEKEQKHCAGHGGMAMRTRADQRSRRAQAWTGDSRLHVHVDPVPYVHGTIAAGRFPLRVETEGVAAYQAFPLVEEKLTRGSSCNTRQHVHTTQASTT